MKLVADSMITLRFPSGSWLEPAAGSLLLPLHLVGLFSPNAVAKLASSAQLRLMRLLHFSRPKELFGRLVFVVDVPQQLEDGVSDAERCLVNVLLPDTLLVHEGSLERKLSRVSVAFAVNTVESIGNDSYVDDIFH